MLSFQRPVPIVIFLPTILVQFWIGLERMILIGC